MYLCDILISIPNVPWLKCDSDNIVFASYTQYRSHQKWEDLSLFPLNFYVSLFASTARGNNTFRVHSQETLLILMLSHNTCVRLTPTELCCSTFCHRTEVGDENFSHGKQEISRSFSLILMQVIVRYGPHWCLKYIFFPPFCPQQQQ